MTSYFFQRLRNRISTPVGHCLLSKRTDDIYIAAFPRSGSTWLRTILVNVLNPAARSNPDVFNTTIPAVSIRNARLINQLPSPRMIMTHSCQRPDMHKVVYLLRDGRDAFISSYHYHVTRNNLPINIEQYYQLYRSGTYGPTWEQNVLSWLAQSNTIRREHLMIVRFEEMKERTKETIISICSFIGLDADEESISKAITQASLEQAKKIESLRDGTIQEENASFYRQGTSQQWKQAEYQEVIELFTENAAEALKLAGYLS